MEKFGNYYKLLDELRIAKSMTIQDLCEGLRSERTYLRHMQNGSKVNFTTFTKLLTKLGINLAQFMTYMIHFNKVDNGVTRFTSRVHFAHFMDIDPIYERILEFKSSNPIEELMVKAFILTYELEIEKINKAQFKVSYGTLLNDLQALKADTIISSLIEFMYHIHFKDESLVDVAALGQKLLNYNSTLSLFYYIMFLDLFMYYLTKEKYEDIVLYEKLLDKLTVYLQYLHIKNFELTIETYSAYLHHIQGDIDQRDTLLYKAFMNSIVVHSLNAKQNYQALIHDAFGMDIHDILNNQHHKLELYLNVK